MRLEERIRVFEDSKNGIKIEFRQIRFDDRRWIDMYVYVNGCVVVKGFYENRKQVFRIIKACENAKDGLLLQAVFSKLN